MKKNIFTITSLALASVLIISSCKKEVLNNEPLILNNEESYQLDKSIPLISNPYSTKDYLFNKADVDDEKISTHLFEIALVTRNLFKDNSFNQLIIKEAKQHDNSCISLQNFISSLKELKLKRDDIDLNKIESVINNVDLSHKSTNPARGEEIENYIPAIFVANINNADFNKLPIISSGTYVNTELAGMEKYEDYIVAWYADPNGNFNEILINEATAQTTTHPIFIIDNAEEEISKRKKSPVGLGSFSPVRNVETAWYSSYEYQINHRYDNTNNSEFCITGAHINETGNIQLICRESNGTFNTWKKIAEVNKNDIGNIRYQWEQFCTNNVTPLNSNFIFWNTFERDWAKSAKDLGSATRNGATIYLNGNRQYSSEWYAYDPGDLNTNPVDLNTIYSSWAKWHDNSKGRFRIWRIQP